MKSKTLIATLILVAAAALISLSFPFATQTIPVTYTSYSVSYGHIQTYQLQTNSVEVACLTMESTQTVCTSDQFGFDAESWADYYCASAYYSGQNCVLVGSTTYNTNVETSSGYSVLETSTLALQEVSTNTNGPLYMSLGVSTPEFLLGSMVLLFFPIAIIVWVPIIQRKLATTKRTKEAPKKLVPNDVRVEVKTSSTPALTNGKNRAVSSGSTEKTASDWNTPLCKTCSQPMIFDAKYQGQRWLCCKDRLMFYPPQNFWYKWEDDAVVRTGATPFMDHHSRSKVNTGAMSTDTVFLAASTIARRDVIRARDSRTQSEIDYQADSKRFGGELTLSEADKRLRIDAKEIQEFLTTQANGDERGLEARRMILDVRWDQENPTTTKRLYQ
ncbi:MAG TPA: hypothetical protein VE862_09325, partial [Candidatus Acidoferrum sp.]|nr:hypothetical protein [Candidatus Acidoferrum sp.]